MATRKTFTTEEKEKALELLKTSTLSKVSNEIGCSINSLLKWKNNAKPPLITETPTQPNDVDEMMEKIKARKKIRDQPVEIPTDNVSISKDKILELILQTKRDKIIELFLSGEL